MHQNHHLECDCRPVEKVAADVSLSHQEGAPNASNDYRKAAQEDAQEKEAQLGPYFAYDPPDPAPLPLVLGRVDLVGLPRPPEDEGEAQHEEDA